jgi:hypothetical protein
MALVRWIQMGMVLGSLLFGWLLGSKNEETPAPEPPAQTMEITVRLQDGGGESLWTGFVVLADSAALGTSSSVEVNLGTGWSSAVADSDEEHDGDSSADLDTEPGTELGGQIKLRSAEWVTSLQSIDRKVERFVDAWGKDWEWAGNLRGKR